MENGYLILGIIALLFLSMYGYSYFSVAMEKARQTSKMNKELKKKEERLKRRDENQKIRDKKLMKFNKRKEEIQRELVLLKKMKDKLEVS
ncbi:hypothetical protein A8C32_07665 [Flavivirga aquatica]|uniref:Uncharacterized protein n=1 Tax=Flavivirga aquatica TaxID=1849968 RepID=A0A1E5SIV6_9FLAO|nr:hypothetical protein [Flavivirga aquatica]OEJ99045.1 hypothetical protein A8C32_07665 [Flavivirga aquatica]